MTLLIEVPADVLRTCLQTDTSLILVGEGCVPERTRPIGECPDCGRFSVHASVYCAPTPCQARQPKPADSLKYTACTP